MNSYQDPNRWSYWLETPEDYDGSATPVALNVQEAIFLTLLISEPSHVFSPGVVWEKVRTDKSRSGSQTEPRTLCNKIMQGLNSRVSLHNARFCEKNIVIRVTEPGSGRNHRHAMTVGYQVNPQFHPVVSASSSIDTGKWR